MEKGRIADDIYIRMLLAEPAQALHRILMRLWLPDIESNLVLKILPAIGHGIVHMYRVPDKVCQKADSIFMKKLCFMNHNTAGSFLVFPPAGRQDFPAGTVDDFPPACDIIPGIDLHQFIRYALHQGKRKLFFHRSIKSGHNVALLYLIRVRLRPFVVLAGCIICRIYFCSGPGQLLWKFRAVTVADCIGTPAA